MYLNIDLARGIAALGVFLFHIQGTLLLSVPALAAIAKYGSLGVPLFFVISGYVITASAESTIRKNTSAASFLKRRFLRIFPPFWISLLVVILLPFLVEAISTLKSGQFHMPSPRYFELSASEWIEVITLTKVFTSPDANLQAQFNQINAVYWTLAIEFQFYLCVFVALLFRKQFHRILLAITALSFLIIAFPQPLNPGLCIFYWPMFAMGIGLYYGLQTQLNLDKTFSKAAPLISAVLVTASLCALLLLAYLDELGDLLLAISNTQEFSFAILSASILWLASPLDRILDQMRHNSNMLVRGVINFSAFLGVISYSLYLLHGKSVELPAMVARQLVPMDNPLFPLIAIGGTIVLCYVFYLFFEKPFMSCKQQEISQMALAR